MKATPGQQQLLLRLNELGLELARSKKTLAELQSGVALEELRAELRKSSEVMLAAQARHEDLTVEITRVINDLEMVETRIGRDLQRLSTSTNSKDIAGVQSELSALENRKSILETSELELLEARDLAEVEVSESKTHRAEISEKLARLEESFEAEIGRLQSAVSIIEEQIRSTRFGLGEEILSAFDRKSARGIPIGPLDERDCGACRLALTSAVFSEVMGAPENELPTCPNCEAFLVR